jgi:hypothetical protein
MSVMCCLRSAHRGRDLAERALHETLACDFASRDPSIYKGRENLAQQSQGHLPRTAGSLFMGVGSGRAARGRGHFS